MRYAANATHDICATGHTRCQRRSPILLLRKVVIYDILFKASAETTITIAADKKRFASIMRHHRE